MYLKTTLNPLFSVAARICEKSQFAEKMLRAARFRGKGLIVQQLRSMHREVVASCNGIRYQLDLGDDVQRSIYFGLYEREDLECALRLVPSGGTCLDVGANNGAFALEFGRKVGSHGVVHAFEPDPVVYSRLLLNCRLNKLESVVKCHSIALSNVNRKMPFYRSSREHSGWGSLVEFKDIAESAESIEAITLDEFIAREDIHRVDFLKVDVEAHEPELLEGAQKSLSNQIFQYILIEFNGIRLAERGRGGLGFFEPLEKAGYAPVLVRLDLMDKLRKRLVPSETVLTNFLFAPVQH